MAAAAIPAIIGGISFLSGLFGDKSKQQTTGQQTSSQDSNTSNFIQNLLNSITQQQQSYKTVTKPNLSPEYQGFISNLLNIYSKNMNQAPITMDQYMIPQIQSINSGADAQSTTARNIMASRGLATSPVAATSEANIDANRISSINKVAAGAPVALQQIRNDAMSPYANVMSILAQLSGTTTEAIGTGMTSQQQQQDTAGTTRGQTTGTTNQTGTVSGTQGGGVGGGLSGLGDLLTWLYASGKIGGK